MAHGTLNCSLALPAAFREHDIFAFNSRDALAIAECTESRSLQKGLVWKDTPACLQLRFSENRVDVVLALDGRAQTADIPDLAAMVRRMLGLTQNIEDFERIYQNHPQLGILIATQPGLRVPLAATPFEALTWAITGQQISVAAAVSMRRKLIQAAGVKHSDGLYCYPDAGQIARLNLPVLRQAGFSRTKAQTLLTLSQRVTGNELPLMQWLSPALPVEALRTQLLNLRGIGPWTVNYALLRGFGWLDGSLHGDAGVRRGLQTLLGIADKVTEDHAQQWLAPFSPWRALIAAHLWALPSSFSSKLP
ncbi:MAG: 3-methyladenine DNA glycosylase 2 [Gammaproteobacteria bacterium HGW-Gammaproteobacteria-3]|nr:MAG: 3-methyladenine DNA glycosylase 2 [Gammaproteobacteria bacterium HGW-Gammaproteobacteria-3]